MNTLKTWPPAAANMALTRTAQAALVLQSNGGQHSMAWKAGRSTFGYRKGIKVNQYAWLRAVISLVITGAAMPVLAEPQVCGPVVYQDMPVATLGFSTSVSKYGVGGPVLADDFIPAVSGQVRCVDWWGTRAPSAQWELTLYLGNGGPGPLPAPPSTGGFKLFADASGSDADGDGIFWYHVEINDARWSVIAGQQYWFGAANALDGWAWARADGVPEAGAQIANGVRSVGAVPCPDGGPNCGPWAPQQSQQYAFMLQTPESGTPQIPEPGTLALIGVALAGLGASMRKRATGRGAT